MRINLISLAKDSNDKRSWSGTPYMVLKSLQAIGHEVNVLNYMPDKYPVFHRIIIRLYGVISRATGKKYLYWFTSLFQKLLKKRYSQLRVLESDLTFVVGQSFLIPPIIPCKTKLVYLCDATFSAVEDYYPEFSDLYKIVSCQGNRICREALLACDKIIMSSNWAKQHAVEDYHISPAKIDVVEFGANIVSVKMGSIERDYSNKQKYRILFSGVHWERKGGKIAVECCDYLISKGYNIELIVAGVDVPMSYERTYIRPVGFLNKNIEKEYVEYVRILEEADFLLFPSKAECSAIALCEAAGFSLPVFGYKTGGLENYVKDGFNGYLLTENNSGKEFAMKIDEVIGRGELKELSENSKILYTQTLNWTVWGERVRTIINQL